MENFRLISTGADVQPLLSALRRQPAIWDDDSRWAKSFPHRQSGVQTIMLRFMEPGGRYADFPHYGKLPEVRPLVADLLSTMGGGEVGIVWLNTVAAGGFIGMHDDPPQVTREYDRFHVVLATNPKALFKCGNESVNMGQGEVWWFDDGQRHGVQNDGEGERIHLVVDIRLSAGKIIGFNQRPLD